MNLRRPNHRVSLLLCVGLLSVRVADLGYDASESYGLSYKARGLCNDHSNLDIYDDDNGLNVGVTGDIMRSNIHHNVG